MNKKNFLATKCVLLLFLPFILTSCYSFNGSSLSKDIKKAQIFPIVNNAPLKNLLLANDFTNALTNRINDRTNLILTNSEADILIKGEITNYALSFANISSEGNANQNRLSITININYENRKEPTKSFEKTFDDFENFSADRSLSDVEKSLVSIIVEKLIDKIFNAIITDW